MGNSKNRPQVFINFRGKDERQKLLPHLKHHLKDRNTNVFTDDDAVGEPLKNLFKHIRRSRIVIVIFSINYLESEWCLDELVEIRKCLETEKIDFAIPIFYKTSHVKQQSGNFGKKFVALQKKHRSSRIRRWKKALRYVAKSIGLTYKKRSSISELDFIKKIVEIVDLTLTKISSKDNNSLETSKGEPSNLVDVNKMLNLSRTLDTRDLEISYRQGFMVGSAWKDGIISSMQSRIYNWGVEPRPLFSRRFAAFVPAPTCYSRPLELNVLPDYRPTFSYYNIIYQHPPWPHATRYSNEQRFQPIMDHAVGSSATFATSEGITSSISSDFGIDPTSMNDDIVLTLAFAAEAEDRTSFTSLDFDECSTTTSMHDEIVSGSNNTVTENMTRFSSSDLDQYPTMDPTIMHNDIVSASQAGKRENKKSCISILCSWFKRCFSLTRGAKAADEV